MVMIPANDDFQAVIFAGGKGSRMSQLLGGRPKCLLPIANKPMIAYPLELLVRSEIKGKNVRSFGDHLLELKI